MENITLEIKVKKTDLDFVASFLKKMRIPFSEAKISETYNADFIAKIKKGEEDYNAGNYKAIKTEDIWK